MQNHIKIHSEERPFKCEDCDYRSRTSGTLSSHRLYKHTSDVAKIRSCHLCPFKAKTSAEISTHLKLKHFRDQMKQYKCDKCSYVINSKHSLKLHKANHDEATHECEKCGRKYQSLLRLNNHVRRVHNKQNSIPCSHCDQKFQTHEKLRRHMLYVTGAMPHTCRICAAGYLGAGTLKKHFEKYHSGQPIFFCEPCDFGTNRGIDMNVHECGSEHQQKAKHFSSSTDSLANKMEMHKCEKCAYSTPNRTTLKRHVAAHHPSEPV